MWYCPASWNTPTLHETYPLICTRHLKVKFTFELCNLKVYLKVISIVITSNSQLHRLVKLCNWSAASTFNETLNMTIILWTDWLQRHYHQYLHFSSSTAICCILQDIRDRWISLVGPGSFKMINFISMRKEFQKYQMGEKFRPQCLLGWLGMGPLIKGVSVPDSQMVKFRKKSASQLKISVPNRYTC